MLNTIRDCSQELQGVYDFMRTRKASMNPPKDPPPKQEPPPHQSGSSFQWDGDIQHLPVKETIKRLILDGAPKGQRSEAMMTVLNALVWSGLTDEQIFGVFLAYPIGEKFRDDRHGKIEWLQPQIDRARAQTTDRASASGTHNYQEQAQPESSFISLVDIEAMEFEHDPIIDGLLDKKESLLLVAESGIGKSMIFNQILFNLAMPPYSGLWAKFPIKRPAIGLFMQSENTMKAESFRLKRLFRAHPEFKQAGDRVMTFKIDNDIRISGSLVDKEFQKKIVSACLTVGADVLVIDPLISFHESDENSNTEMRTSLDALTAIQDKAKVSSILSHHTGKNGDSRGASAIKDWVANQLKFTREVTEDPERYVLRVQHEKARNFPQKPDFFLERTSDFDFVLVDQPGGKEASQIRGVVDSLSALGGSVESQSKLIEAIMMLMNCGRTHAQKAIDYALRQKKIVIVPGKTQNKTGYRLPVATSEKTDRGNWQDCDLNR